MEPKLHTYSETQKKTKAYKFFNSLKYGDYCNNWKDFELYIKECFEAAGYTVIDDIKKCKISMPDELSLKDYVKLIRKELEEDLAIVNTMKQAYKDIVIYQPFGTTAYPDFLWITPNWVVPVECKTRNKKTPKWNTMPTGDALIFFASTKEKILTYFWGYQVIDMYSRRELTDIKEKIDNLLKTEISRTKNLKNRYQQVYFDFRDFNDTEDYLTNKYTVYRQDHIVKTFVKDK